MDFTEDSCAICQTFVSNLKKVYDAIKQGRVPDDDYQIQWTFRDCTPSLPGLADSAKYGCSWCAILDKAITPALREHSSYNTPNGQQNVVNFTFHCDRTRQNAGPLGNVGKLSIRQIDREIFDLPDNKIPAHDIYVTNYEGFIEPWTSNIEIIRDAINRCVNDHQTCPGPELKASPLRLINVMDGDFIKLESPGDKTHIYTALSYCWGESEINKTTKFNVEARMSPFPLNELPLTLQDAIAFTRHLKIQYIWIDAICIVQDCTKEWTSEAQKMMQYYRHARVTIVPIESASADSGMSMGYDPSCRKFPGPWSADLGMDLILSNHPPGQGDSIFESVWNTRGWTYQERLNSSCILFVFRHKLRLECRAGSFDTLTGWESTETNRFNFLPHSGTVADRDFHHIHKDWREIVQLYTRRKLTLSKDRWFAFSGIVEAFQNITDRQIIAGLWEDKILEDMVSWAATPMPYSRSTRLPIFPVSNPTLSSSSYGSPICSNCNSSECRENSSENGPNRLSFPSWTWLNTEISDMQLGGRLAISTVEMSQVPSSRLLRVIKGDKGIGSFKLSISGAVLSQDELLGLLADCHDRRLVCPGRGTGTTFLDKGYDKVNRCLCDKEHHEADRTSYHVICSLAPTVLALLVGSGYFAEWAVRDLIWHFVLIQSVHISYGGNELLEYRRIGTMHIPDDRLNMDTKQKLETQQQKEIILV
ncbi:heterokaryon incompatibility protein-domain-containing protein [Xylaria digitata]|nr:heterokaryon incompatibility protein-domain-containing protein [Xylaria digitata]